MQNSSRESAGGEEDISPGILPDSKLNSTGAATLMEAGPKIYKTAPPDEREAARLKTDGEGSAKMADGSVAEYAIVEQNDHSCLDLDTKAMEENSTIGNHSSIY